MFNSHCCGFYSFTGVVFMMYVYLMLKMQPQFITGIEDLAEARSNAFGAMIMFCVTFGVSSVMIMKEKGSQREYDTSEDDHNRLNIDLKSNYGAVATDSY